MSESDAEFVARLSGLSTGYPIEFNPDDGNMDDWSRLLSLARRGAEMEDRERKIRALIGDPRESVTVPSIPPFPPLPETGDTHER